MIRRYFSTGLLICLALLFAGGWAVASTTSKGIYRLEVSFDPAKGRLSGHADIVPLNAGILQVDLDGLHLLKAEADGHAVSWPSADDETWRVRVRKHLEIHYEVDATKNDDIDVSAHNIALGGNWYPAVHGPYRYRLSAVVPVGWRAVSEANDVHVQNVPGGISHKFDFPHALPHQDGITFIASDQFDIKHGRYRNVDLYAYFLPEEAHHAERFLLKAVEYLTRFEKQLGPYPYRRLSLVEQANAGAHSLPSYVILSPGDIRAAEWENTSLDHEIAHQWLGNLVFTNWDSGNWNEGLTLYMADYLSAEAADRGWECRRRMLLGYGNNIRPDSNFPLVDFAGKDDKTAKYIGYAKAGMVFHMLRTEVGDRRFFMGVRRFVEKNRFRVASWKDIRRAFEATAGRSLGGFFHEWTEESAQPSLVIDGASTRESRADVTVEVVVRQSAPAFQLRVPVSWHFPGGRVEREWVTITGLSTRLQRTFAQAPSEVVLDEQFEIFRALDPSEYPPTLERMLTRPSVVYTQAAQRPGYYEPMIKELRQLGERVIGVTVADRAPRSAGARRMQVRRGVTRAQGRQDLGAARAGLAQRADSVILLGRSDPLLARLMPDVPPASGDFELIVMRHPADSEHYVGLIHARDESAVASALKVLPNLWKTSRLAMKDGKVIEKSVADVPRGIRARIAPNGSAAQFRN